MNERVNELMNDNRHVLRAEEADVEPERQPVYSARLHDDEGYRYVNIVQVRLVRRQEVYGVLLWARETNAYIKCILCT